MFHEEDIAVAMYRRGEEGLKKERKRGCVLVCFTTSAYCSSSVVFWLGVRGPSG
jgi:hypothetical protein